MRRSRLVFLDENLGMSRAAFPTRFIAIWQACPITWVLVIAAVSLHALVVFRGGPEHEPLSAYRDLGLLVIERDQEHPELSGPFDLWAGQWWRVPMGGLFHAGLLHLVIACAFAVYLGRRLEPRLRSVTYLIVLLGAIFVTTLPRWHFGDSVPSWFNGEDPLTGLSGVLFAQYGVLVFLRQRDKELSRSFSESSVLLGIVIALGCLAGSTVGLFTQVDNLAHLVGLGYGLIWGAILSASWVAMRISFAVFLICHLALWPAFERLMHPAGNGRYHWWLAANSDDPDFQRAAYRTVVRLDPELGPPWTLLAESELEIGDAEAAWNTLLEGLAQKPNLDNAEELGRRIWGEFSTAKQRKAAWEDTRKRHTGRLDPVKQLLSPRQAAVFRLETEDPIEAWIALMHELRDLPPPADPAEIPPDIKELADAIWRELSSPTERLRAIEVLDQLLEQSRRAWHLSLLPNRDLIFHYRKERERLWAWEAALKELSSDPAFREEGKMIAGEIWRSLSTDLRRERARKILEDRFRLESLDWQIELGILSEADRERFRLDQSVSLPVPDLDFRPTPSLQPFDPDDPESAAIGTGL